MQESAGCRYVILDATPDRVSFYQALGLERNDAMNREKRRQAKENSRDPDLETVSMRFDLRE